MKEAATDSVVVDLAEWLAHHSSTADQIEAVATKISDEVMVELDLVADASRLVERRRTLAASHFWCDILAGLAKTLNDVQEEIDEAVGQIPQLVISTLNPNTTIEKATVELAVEKTWEQVKDLDFMKTALKAYDLGEPIRAARMLAVMICPAPEQHEAVVRHCLNPFIGDYVSNLTKQRLEAALPDSWLE